MKKILSSLSLLIVIAVLVIALMPNIIIKKAINNFGSELFQTNVNVESVDLSFTSGSLVLKGLTIANPKGYNEKNALTIDNISVLLDVWSIFSDKVVINEVIISEPIITVEVKLASNNLNDLKNKYGQKFNAPNDNSEVSQEKKTGKKVVIDRLSISNAKIITATSVIMNFKDNAISIPNITMTDIGKQNAVNGDGLTFAEAITDILLEVASKAPNLNNNLLERAKEGLKGQVNKAKDKVDDISKKLKNLF